MLRHTLVLLEQRVSRTSMLGFKPNCITKLYQSCLGVMVCLTILSEMKFSITGTQNSHVWINPDKHNFFDKDRLTLNMMLTVKPR